jgi:hypothetical protein
MEPFQTWRVQFIEEQESVHRIIPTTPFQVNCSVTDRHTSEQVYRAIATKQILLIKGQEPE